MNKKYNIIKIIDSSTLNIEKNTEEIKQNFLTSIYCYDEMTGQLIIAFKQKINKIEKYGLYKSIEKIAENITKNEKIKIEINLFNFKYFKDDVLANYEKLIFIYHVSEHLKNIDDYKYFIGISIKSKKNKISLFKKSIKLIITNKSTLKINNYL